MGDRWLDRLARPRVAAVVMAGVYVAFSAVYIVASSRLAATRSRSVEEMEQVERYKGVAFVVLSGVLIHVIALSFMRRLERQRDALLVSEHRALSGLFASSIAHDINNVTTVARGSAELLLAPAAGADTKKLAADNLQESFVRLASLSHRLMTLGRAGLEGSVQDRELVAAIERAVALARRHERVRRCRVSTSLGDALVMPIDEVLVDRMILNLVLNAADATEGSGRIEIRLLRDEARATLEVHDDGPGVPDEVRDSIFDAFYTSKPNGLGLGLVSVRACAEAHGGSVEVKRSDLGGAAFRVTLPRSRRAA